MAGNKATPLSTLRANQTSLAGGEVKGPLFDSAPIANEYLRTHLFGDIFQRDNLDGPTREVATLAMLAAIPGAEPQLQAHMRSGMHSGLSVGQLHQLTEVLAARTDEAMPERARAALQRHLASLSGQ